MRIGFIFECQPQGPDEQVYRVFARKLQDARVIAEFELDVRTLSNKRDLVSGCGAAASILLESCNHVFICWDLHPSWRSKGEPPCLHVDREDIKKCLHVHGVPTAKTTMLCISEELEAWLIADGAAFVSQKQRDASPRTKHERFHEQVGDVKKKLAARWRDQLKRCPYNDWFHAKDLAEASDLSRVASAESFCRLVRKVRNIVGPGAGAAVKLCE